MNLLRAVLNEPWMIDPATKDAWLPKVLRMVKGEDVNFGDKDNVKTPFAYHSKMQTSYSNFANAPSGSVAVFPITGPITKYDGWCNYGTESLMSRLKKADQQSNIVGHLLEIDSGGGQGTNLETVVRYIQTEISKPIVAWYNGTCASAAYYIAVAADEIYASEETDIVGSIGVMLSFMDLRKFYESQGVTMHEVYADQSTLKNDDFIKARDGEYDLIKEGFLNPYAQRFIETVKEMRPAIQESDVFKGKVYMSDDAEEIGLIDGILTFKQAINRVNYLATNNSQQNISTNMKRIEAVLGYELESQDGGAFLRADEMAKLEKRIVLEKEVPVEVDALASIQADLGSISTKMTEMSSELDDIKALNTTAETSISNLSAQVEANKTELGRIAGQPGAGATRPASNGDPIDPNAAQGRKSEFSELDELEAATAATDSIIIG